MFTFSNVAVVMVFAKLDSKLDDDPDANGNEAACADLGHDLQHLMRQNLIFYNALACDEQDFCTSQQRQANRDKRTFWMLGTLWTPLMRAAERPKKVLGPVAYTTACLSPCLMVDPPKTTSPGPFFAGSDSPVRAAWSTCQ